MIGTLTRLQPGLSCLPAWRSQPKRWLNGPPPPQGSAPTNSPGQCSPVPPLHLPEQCPLHFPGAVTPSSPGAVPPTFWGRPPPPLQGSAPHHLPRQGSLPTSLSNTVPHVQHLCDLGPQTMSLEKADKACGGSPGCPRGRWARIWGCGQSAWASSGPTTWPPEGRGPVCSGDWPDPHPGVKGGIRGGASWLPR